ncbi:MAG TPA: caspase family protein [Myxococcota bacterium]|nr:caspase family protein [Myxococcota bacterium]
MVQLLVLATALSSEAEAEVGRRALLVGANDGGIDLPALRYTQNDVARMEDVLVELGGFEPEDIVVLQGPDGATLAVELQRMQYDSVAGEDIFLFYYSGHADARGLRLGDDVYPFEELREDFARTDADVKLGILDACRSGQITQAKGAVVVDPFLADSLDAQGVAWITASSGDELAQESRSLRGSFFTHHLVSGMRGAADNGDGVVSLSEAYSYAYAQTVERTSAAGATQHPEYDFQIAGKGDLALTTLSKATSHVTLSAGYGGEIAILRDGLLVAEVDKPVDQEMTLALQPGTYTLRRREGEKIYEVRLGVEEGAHRTVGTRWGESATEVASWKGTVPRPGDLDTQKIVESTVDAARDFEFRHNPYVAMSFSTLVPGAGQMYNRQYGKGLLYLGSTYVLVGTGFAFNTVGDEGPAFKGSVIGPTPANAAGFALWGMAMSQAYYQQKYGDDKPERKAEGVHVSLETAWTDDWDAPHTAGIAVDWVITPGVSIGLDRTGWTKAPDSEDTGVFNIGGRIMVAPEWQRFRPGVFGATNLRIGRHLDTQRTIRPVLGAGVQFRWFVTPRYYLTFESRGEYDDGELYWVNGGGLGVQLGG